MNVTEQQLMKYGDIIACSESDDFEDIAESVIAAYQQDQAARKAEENRQEALQQLLESGKTFEDESITIDAARADFARSIMALAALDATEQENAS